MSHVESHISRCYKCDFESDDKSQMVRHEKEHIQPCDHNGECSKIQHTERNEPQADNKQCFRCDECSLDFESGVEMVKTNKNKKGLAEKMAGKSKKAAKLNPFDVRFVKSKQVVLGRRNKNDIGKPGVARAKAIQKRKETLLQEYQLKNKSNMFMDKSRWRFVIFAKTFTHASAHQSILQCI